MEKPCTPFSEIPDAPFDIGSPLETPAQARSRQKAVIARAHRLAMQREARIRLYGGARRPKQDRALWTAALLGVAVVLIVIFWSEPIVPLIAGY